MKNFGKYFSIKILTKAFVAASTFSLPIYLAHFGLYNQALNTIIVLLAFWLLLSLRPLQAFWSGFFIGIFWFYWIALSFRYYDLAWMIPFVMLFVGLTYGALLFFGYALAYRFSKAFVPLFWWGISFLHPFGFNWFVPDMLLAHTYLYADKLHFLLLLSLLEALVLLRSYGLSFFLLFCINFSPHHLPLPPLKIELVTTHIPQNEKWLPSAQESIINQNFKAIQRAITHHADLVVLPESAFPLFLNKNPILLKKLRHLSYTIAILTGALYLKDGHYYNSSYLFDNGEIKIFNKVVLVPFGEEIPLPQPFARWINKYFFQGSSDYTSAKTPSTFTIKGISFTNAICYEATHPLLYQTQTPYIIAISNNAWFLPSIEPTLQWMLIKYYATIYKKIVFHATNYAKTAIVKGR